MTFECYQTENESPDDPPSKVEATDAETAAEEYAERFDADSGEGYSDEQTIGVRRVHPPGPWVYFRVTAQASVDYWAHEVSALPHDGDNAGVVG